MKEHMKEHMNYTLLCDFYELTMGNGYFQTGMDKQICYFDVFFRNVPDGAASPLRRGWSRSSTISKSCALTRRTSPTCGAKIVSAPNFWSI